MRCSRAAVMMRALCIAALAAAACSHGSDAGYDYATSKGAAIYRATCQVCHGETGEGGLGPPLLDDPKSTSQLVQIISSSMPANAPGQCTGACASQTAEFIHDGLTSRSLQCKQVAPAPRRLRLLTRREYRATIHDLFGDAMPAMACARATDCVYRDTCQAGACEPTACDAQTFVYDPHGQALTSVHVAGDFNHWPQTIAGGGLPLTRDAASGLWVGTFTLGEGHHDYKLVLDEQTWITDPRAPATESDGYGGQNSVVELSCAGAGAAASDDVTADFPVETRAADFPFDDDADAALVTSAHVDAYLDAAEKIAGAAAADPGKLVACDWAGARATCGGTLVAQLGERLFRRPLTPDEQSRYEALIAAGSDASGGVRTALEAMLMSPHFLYRSELGAPDGHGHYKLTPYELATALSYALLGTTPGDDLLAAAGNGELDDAAGLERWARKLVADPRARAQIGEFALEWTGASAITTTAKRMDLYPDFTDAVRASLADETRNFTASVVFDGSGTLGELLTAKYTVVDATAAAFYGLAGAGKVTFPDGKRAGLLGEAAVLATTAHSDQTSPVERGLLVRRNFLCEDLPPPPPNGGTLPPVDPSATTRERFAMHSTDPTCAGCHRYLDPVGFGFASFDPVGRWRDTDNGQPVDASGDMNDVERLGTGTSAPFATLPDLARTIAASHAAGSCFVRQYLRFTRGLRETLAERCGRLWLEAKFQAAGGNIQELMVQSVLDPDFVERR